MDAPAADPGCSPKPCQGCEQWDAGADKGSSFQLPPERRSNARGQGRVQGGALHGRPGSSPPAGGAAAGRDVPGLAGWLQGGS